MNFFKLFTALILFLSFGLFCSCGNQNAKDGENSSLNQNYMIDMQEDTNQIPIRGGGSGSVVNPTPTPPVEPTATPTPYPPLVPGFNIDQFGSSEEDHVLAQTVDDMGNVYVAGYTSDSIEGNFNFGDHDFFVAKYHGGQKIWLSQMGTSSSDLAASVATDTLGYVYVAGYTMGQFDGNPIGGGGIDTFVAKYSPEGDIIWIKQFGDQNEDMGSIQDECYLYGCMVYPTKIAFDSLNNMYISLVLWVESGGDDHKTVIQKSDSELNFAKRFTVADLSGEDKLIIADLIFDDNDKIIIAGSTNHPFGSGVIQGDWDIFIAAYPKSCEEYCEKLWGRTIGTTGWDNASGISMNKDSSKVILEGTVTNSQINPDNYDKVLFAFTDSGVLQWGKQIKTGTHEMAMAVDIDDQDNIYVAGDLLNQYHDSNLIFIDKFNSKGQLLCTKVLGNDDERDNYQMIGSNLLYGGNNLFVSSDGRTIFASGTSYGPFASYAVDDTDGYLLSYFGLPDFDFCRDFPDIYSGILMSSSSSTVDITLTAGGKIVPVAPDPIPTKDVVQIAVE